MVCPDSDHMIDPEFNMEATRVGLWGSRELWRSRSRAWQTCSPDGFTWDEERPRGQMWGLIEAKTGGFFQRDKWDDEPPEDYIIQVQHNLSVLGLQWCASPVLLGGQDFRIYITERDERLISAINRAEEQFMEYVRKDEQPPVDSHPDTLATLKRLHPDDSGETLVLPDQARKIAAALGEYKRHIKVAEGHARACEAQLRAWIGDATYGMSADGEVQYSLKTTQRKDGVKFRTLRRQS